MTPAASIIYLAAHMAAFAAPSSVRAQVLPPPPILKISIDGDSLAEGIGQEFCKLVKRRELPYECSVNAQKGITSSAAVELVDLDADIVLFSGGTNDKPCTAETGFSLMRAFNRVKVGARMIFVLPAKDVCARGYVSFIAWFFGADTLDPVFGKYSFMARIHPRSYLHEAERLARLLNR